MAVASATVSAVVALIVVAPSPTAADAAARFAAVSLNASVVVPVLLAPSIVVAKATDAASVAVIFTASLRPPSEAPAMAAAVSLMLYTTALAKAAMVVACAAVARVFAVTVPARVSTAFVEAARAAAGPLLSSVAAAQLREAWMAV